MSTLTVTADHDYSADSLSNITAIVFANPSSATAVFLGSQFDGVQISPTALVTGNASANGLEVNGPRVDLSGLSFSSWTPGDDVVVLNGTGAGFDLLTGSSQNDILRAAPGSGGSGLVGGGGADALIGSAGADAFEYFDAAEIVPGESVQGGAGTDDLIVANSLGFDFSTIALQSVERLIFVDIVTSVQVVLAGDQIGAGAITVVASEGLAGAGLSVIGTVDLSGVQFVNFNDADSISIRGTAGADIVIGSDHDDAIFDSPGADTISGGAGNDAFLYFGLTVDPGESLDGGPGNDRIRLFSFGNYDFAHTSLVGVETLEYSSPVALAVLADNQIGKGSATINTVIGDSTSTLEVLGNAVDLSTVGFQNWNASDAVVIDGSSATSNVIVGSSQSDIITVPLASLSNSLTGGGGADRLDGSNGTDAFIYLAPGDLVAGETVNGRNGSDSIDLRASGTFDFTVASLNSVEILAFDVATAHATAILAGDQIRAGKIEQVSGDPGGADSIVVNGADVDLRQVSFVGWIAGVDGITINGTDPHLNVLFGSDQDDTINIASSTSASTSSIRSGAGDDTLTGGLGNDALDGGAGDDSAVFSHALAGYSFSRHGDVVTISGPDGIDTLTSVEHLRFTDGTVDLGGNDLFDAPFYDRSNPDVFHAGLNAFDHYNTVGFHEGLDPDAFFDTSGYLAVNRDVAAADVNPLVHFDQFGWREGRNPGPDFDTRLYLLHNPDVAAAGIDPLAHFLTVGLYEGRATFAAIGTLASGFDAEFYLLHNPDVAAAGIDPLSHFNTFGWKEGRNPNLDFDTKGYLAHYADVAAAGVNPLAHYEQFGFREGRDPSAAFDTLGYLAANGDIAAAHVNPLDHFLNFGIYEGRAGINDGIFH